jgi:hypothetical protein
MALARRAEAKAMALLKVHVSKLPGTRYVKDKHEGHPCLYTQCRRGEPVHTYRIPTQKTHTNLAFRLQSIICNLHMIHCGTRKIPKSVTMLHAADVMFSVSTSRHFPSVSTLQDLRTGLQAKTPKRVPTV